MIDIALLTERRFDAREADDGDWYMANILRDDGLLQEHLATYGLSTVRVDWANPEVEWGSFRCAVFRTTWDYFDRHDEFRTWLEQIRLQTKLINVAEQIAWNMDKRYLADLERRGVTIVPTQFVSQGSQVTLRSLMESTGWDDAVIKPVISGAARHTFRVHPSNVDSLEIVFGPLLDQHTFMFQPFAKRIQEQGELSLMVFGGRYSHAVRKVPKAGDFRVQDDHGGKVYVHEATAEEKAFAERAVAACDTMPTYGRVDVVRNESGGLELMELELIEPELWLRNSEGSAALFARAIADQYARWY